MHRLNLDAPDIDDDGDPGHEERVCAPVVGKLSAASVHFESVVFTEKKMERDGPPEYMNVNTSVKTECGPKDASFTHELTRQTRKTVTVSTTHGISNTVEGSAKFEMKLSDSMGAGFGFRDAYQVTNTTQDQTSNEDGEGLRMTDIEPAPSMMQTIFEVWDTRASVHLSWRATVVVDGQLAANKDGLTTISQVLSPEERTFSLEGVIRNVTLSEHEAARKSIPLTAAQCDATTIPETQNFRYFLFPPEQKLAPLPPSQ